MSAHGSIRAFVALDLGAAMREKVAALVARIRPGVGVGRWASPEAVHLTLRFLGATTAEQITALRPALVSAAAVCGPAIARVAGLGTFPPRGRPRVLWLGVDLPEPVLELQAACEEAAVAVGFAPETRPFRPHLTLARFKQAPRLPPLPAADLGRTRVEALHLMRSDLAPDGARYTVLEQFGLGDAE